MFEVFLVFDDGNREIAFESHDLEDALSFALDLADEIGLRPAGDGHGPPKRVDVFRGNRLEVSIQIIPGGLIPRKGAPTLRSM